MLAKKTASKRLQQRAAAGAQRRMEEQRREMLARRLDILREGLRLFREGKKFEALRRYTKYIGLLEYWKKCGPGGLLPEQFAEREEATEVMLIAFVFWDLAKTYDQSPKPQHAEHLRLYLEKFVVFSKPFAHRGLAAKSTKKYLNLGDCKHPVDFRSTYKLLKESRCFIATELLGELAPETYDRLVGFRDGRLRGRAWGRFAIACYYRFSPPLARALSRAPPPVRRLVAGGLDRLAVLLR